MNTFVGTVSGGKPNKEILKVHLMRYLVLFVSILFFNVTELSASHISGGSIKYANVGTNSWYIEAGVFRDCSGATFTSTSLTITAVCNANLSTQNITVPTLPFVAPTPAPFGGPYSAVTAGTIFGEEVSDVCDKVLNPSLSPNSRCRGGTIQGYTRFKYATTVTLAPCNYWKLGFSPVCCRNTGQSNTSSGSMWVETWFDSQNFPTNTAPEFADEVKPIPSTCVGKTVFYGIGTVDPNGDSLRFELACAKQSSTQCVTYRSGYSALAPAPGLKLDSVTGLISFTPQAVGKRVVAFWVKEYERCTGIWKAQTLRDVQFRIEQCSNNVPRDISGVSNLQGKNAVKLGKYKMQVCNGTTVSWEDTVYDADATDTLVFQSNHAQVLPGSTMQTTFLSRNKAVVKFTWYATIGINPVKIFYMVFNDDRCDYPGNGFAVFEMQVQNSTGAGEDILLCAGVDTAYIEATGGKMYNWKTVYGDSLIWSGPNQNVWGDTTATDTNRKLKFFPKNTTYLEVQSDMRQGCLVSYACQGRDSVKIVAAKDYKLIKQADTTICFHDSSLQLSVVPDSAFFTYSYKWQTNPTLSNDTINNPMATPILSQKYHITVTSDSGCVKEDSIQVIVTPPMPPVINATTASDPACPGVPLKINLSLGRVPTSCGATTAQCVGAVTRSTSDSTNRVNGAGATGATNWPCPYGGAQRTAHQQFLYTAADLSAMGIGKGTIEALGFNVVSTNGVGTLRGYTIRMACVSPNITVLSSWVLSTVQVFNPKSVTPTVGWNSHQFDQNYDYDGRSNILIDVCWNNLSSTATNNASVAYSITPTNTCLGDYNSQFSVCGGQGLQLIANRNRPNLKMSFCGARDSAEFKYKWTPNVGLVNGDSVQNPNVIAHKEITYNVVITDTFGKCSDSTSIKLNMSSLDAGADTTICPNDTIRLNPSVKASCAGRGRYKWTPSQYFPNDSLLSPLVSVPKTTVVTVTFSDSCGCVMTDSLTIFADSLKEPLYANLNPDCGFVNGNIQMTAVGGWGPYTYSIDSGMTYRKSSFFDTLGIGFYDLRVIDSIGCVSPVTADTLFNKGAPKITGINGINISCTSFSDGEIDISTSGGLPPLEYSVDSGATWGLSNLVTNLKAGKYKVIAKGAGGCESFPEYFTLTEPDTFTLDFKINRDSCFELGDGWVEAKLAGGVKPYNVSWTGVKPNVAHPPVVTDTLFSKLYAYNNYYYKAVDSNGCIIDSAFEVNQTPQIVIDSLTFKPATCFGYDNPEIYINAIGGNPALGMGSYSFSLDSGKNYYPPTFGGDPNYAQLDTSIVGHRILPTTHEIYVRDESGCIGKKTILTTQPPLMVLSTKEDSVKICVSNCAKLEVTSVGGNNTNHKYHWTPSVGNTNVVNVCPEANSIYSVYATDAKGCASNSQLMRVYLYDSLKIYTSPDTSICDGGSANLRSYPSGGDEKYKYQWSPFTGLSNAFISNPNASPNQRAVYKVTLSDECGSPSVYDTVTIDILPQPEVNFSGDTLFGCPPLLSKFQNLTKASSKCVWNFGDGSIAETCQDVYKTYTQPGKYDVKLVVVSVDGCRDSLTRPDYVDIYKLPNAGFTMSPQPTDILNTTIDFADASEGRIIEWNWNFASLDTSMERNTSYHFPDVEAGKYPVRLDVYTDLGCHDDTIRYVVINSRYFLYIPSSFTPNGDGKNDTWKPLGTGFEPDFYHVTVYDRWGKLVYESREYADSWDGTLGSTGEKAQVGVYTYKIIAGDANNEKERHELYGTITIVK